MKAWEISKKIVDEAAAVLVFESEEDWTQSDLQSKENNSLRTIWRSKAPGSGAPTSLVAGAVQSVENLGRNVSRAESFLVEGYSALESDDLVKLHRVTHEIFTALNEAPKDEASNYWKYDSYNSFEEFAAACNFPQVVEVDIESASFKERVHKTWMAQFAAGAFGTALEGYSRENILKSFGKVRKYLKAPSVYNDDITYELAFLVALVEKGEMVNSYEIAREWVSRIPYG
ncbi:MAG: ADP-ribosylglycohydrolase family protein, partial [Cellulosilyticaceae bacterium]